MSVRSTFLLIAILLGALLSGVFWVMTLGVQNQQQLAASETRHYESYKLADELRQSSDDLTRMARTTEYLTKPVDRKLLLHFVGKYSARPGEKRVLVVEDDAPTRELVRRTLEQDGWQVLEAENGELGLEQASKEPPGLVVLDLMMPVMDGFQFLREFRKTGAGRATPVLVLTAKDLDRDEQRFLGEQAAAVVQKNAGDLSSAIEEMRSVVAARASRKT